METRFSESARAMRFSAIRKMSAVIERPGIISFAPGQPSPETFPVDAFRSMVTEILDRDGASAFQYILTRGLRTLIDAVREYAAAKGMPAGSGGDAHRGSQQALDLVSAS
jgi:2-aminoadipate transaminase